MSRAPLPLRLLCLKAVLSLSDFEPDAAAVQCIHSVRNTCGISWSSQLQCLRGPTPRVPQGVPQARLQRRLFILFTGHLAVNFGQCPAPHRHVNHVVTKHHQAQFQQISRTTRDLHSHCHCLAAGGLRSIILQLLHHDSALLISTHHISPLRDLLRNPLCPGTSILCILFCAEGLHLHMKIMSPK